MSLQNDYILDLNFGTEGILLDPFDIEKTHIIKNPDLMTIWNVFPQFVNRCILDLLDRSGLVVLGLDVFKLFPENNKWTIHADMGLWDKQDDSAKINWIYGNKNSPMLFFKPKDPTKFEIRTLPLNRVFIEDVDIRMAIEQGKTHSNYIHYELEDLIEVYRGFVGFPSLVQSGVPHTVHLEGNEPRYCVSAVIGDKDNPYRPTTFMNAASKLSSFLKR